MGLYHFFAIHTYCTAWLQIHKQNAKHSMKFNKIVPLHLSLQILAFGDDMLCFSNFVTESKSYFIGSVQNVFSIYSYI